MSHSEASVPPSRVFLPNSVCPTVSVPCEIFVDRLALAPTKPLTVVLVSLGVCVDFVLYLLWTFELGAVEVFLTLALAFVEVCVIMTPQ